MPPTESRSSAESPVLGIDGARSGWVAVCLEHGSFAGCRVAASLAELLAAQPDVAIVAIDVPIGLPEAGSRPADQQARRFVGARRSSIFDVPPRAVLESDSYREANALSRSRFDRGISRQSYALRDKILEAERIATDPRVYEVHPEVSFRAMKGTELDAGKKSWNGLAERIRLLGEAGIVLPDALPCGHVAADDVVDAAAAAWSARRILRGEAGAFPESPSGPVPDGRSERIWF